MRDALLGVPSEGLPSVLGAFLLNIRVFLVAEVFILALGLLIAVVRQIPRARLLPASASWPPCTRTCSGGCRSILVIYIWGSASRRSGSRRCRRSVVFWGTIALVLSYSAYVAEVYRAGIESVHPSQVASARALGLSRWQAFASWWFRRPCAG